MTRTIRMKDITGLKANATTAPYATTEPTKIGGFRPQPKGVIFQENFSQQPDWHSGLEINATGASPAGLPDRVQRAETHQIPEGWYSIRQDPKWAPSLGHSDRHEAIEILASNSDKARSGGKCYVSWRDSYDAGWNYWASESMMLKYFPEGYDQLYVEFYIQFSPDWTKTPVTGSPHAVSKLFRISSWDGEEGKEYSAFGGGNLGPIMLWDYTVNGYGIRNRLSFRGGPHGEMYGFSEGSIEGVSRPLGGSGDLNMNFQADVKGMGVGGADPQIIDRVNGGLIDVNGSDVLTHDQIYGPAGEWAKIAFFVKMNSAPNTNDGIFKQWLNDEQIYYLNTIPWIRSNASTTGDLNAKWNLVAIGGNDFFQQHPNEDRHEEWYSIDDITIRDSIPEELV